MELFEVAFQFLQAIRKRHPQVLEPGRGMHRLELALGPSRDPLNSLTTESANNRSVFRPP